jgi:hypothetical protein
MGGCKLNNKHIWSYQPTIDCDQQFTDESLNGWHECRFGDLRLLDAVSEAIMAGR